jgi:protein TonB
MAPPAKIEETAPNTLPADFGEWDSGQPPETLPDNFNDFDDSLPVASVAAPKAPVPAKAAPVKATTLRGTSGTSEAAAVPRPSAPVFPKAARRSEAVLPAPVDRRAEVVHEHEDETPKKSNKTLMYAGLGLIPLLALGIYLPMRSSKSAPKAAPSSQSESSASTMTAISAPQPTLAKPSPTTTQQQQQQQQQQQAQPGTPSPATATPHVQTDMMNSQLNAPSRISNDLKTTAKDAPPAPGFGAGGLDGLGSTGSIGNVFAKQNGPKVQVGVPRIQEISAGVAQGMLLQKTAPAYPPIAKSARVSGTVVLQATISKTGVIEGLHVVSGPDMLRSAATEAVKTWRYRPYKLNNQPVEVETTVNVVFTLGG